ncbi:MAG: hypothetical protein M1821_003995 [Bathelium mastoideum]|nr:MAG: hypothetical protein M1821_003995 [Bathelium mastoideum]
MPKRKRDSFNENEVTDDRTRRKRDFVVQTISNQEKQISRALKVGKGFERQKLAKRFKNATEKNDNDLARRIESEIEALKALNLLSVAAHHLRKALLKINAVASSPLIPSNQKDIQPISHDAATLNVAARLYSSNPVKTATSRAVEEVSRALGVGKPKQLERSSHSSRNRPPKADHSNNNDHASNNDEDISDDDHSSTTNSYTHSGMREQVKIKPSSESFYADEREDSALLGLGGSSSSSSSPPQFSDIGDDMEQDGAENGISTTGHRPAKLSFSPSASSSTSSPPPIDPRAYPEATQKVRTSRSAFLPSLTMGGYISGSESGSGEDVDVRPARKNRRGQRARQQIWEQKYGNRANHLQKQKQVSERSDRNQGWDPRKGAVEAGNGRFTKSKKNHGPAKGVLEGANATRLSNSRGHVRHGAVHQRKEADDRPLHPSWEAKKRAKEQQKETAAFQGTKITFD